MSLSNILIWLICSLSILLMLLRPRNIGEAFWVSGGTIVLVLGGLVSIREVGQAIYQGLDVYLFLIGMMTLSELAREKGVFDWIAEQAAQQAAGSSRRLFVLIYLAGTVVTALLSNDATAVVLTPAVLTIVRRLKLDPKPYLLACAFIANAASFLLPISNPANLVVFGQHIPSLSPWLNFFFLPSLAAIGVTFLCLRIIFSKTLTGRTIERLPLGPLSFEGKLALSGLIVAAASLLISSALGWSLGWTTCAAALLATLVVSSRDRDISLKVMRSVSWSIIPLVAGLFIFVAALEKSSLLPLLERWLTSANDLGIGAGRLAVAGSIGLLSNVMNNLPLGLLSGAMLQARDAQNFSSAVLIGVDLGPNLSVTGSLATILWLIALRRENVKITPGEFLKVGTIVLPLSLLAAILLLKH